MSAQTYNGWANYETWNVILWIGNDGWNLYQLALDVVRDGGAYVATSLTSTGMNGVIMNTNPRQCSRGMMLTSTASK